MAQALVVDDDPDIRSAIRAWLEPEGVDVVLAETASEGFAAFDRFNFDLMLIDIFLPDVDGLKAIKTLRQQAPETPIIVMSGLVPRYAPRLAPDFFGMAMRVGASYVLPKPFQAEHLVAAVNTCLCALPHTHGRTAAGGS